VTPERLADLCTAAMPEERLTARELEYVCFGPDDEVIGDDGGAATWHLQRFATMRIGWLTLVAVSPDAQGRGIGKELVRDVAGHARAAGATVLMLASSVPRYVWPGVDVTNTRAGMMLESLGFQRDLLGINMRIDTGFRRDAPDGVVVGRATGDGTRDFATREFPDWVPELDVALAKGTAFEARDAKGETIGFCCHSVNRAAWIGPMATAPSLQHGGVGSAVLAAVCADLAVRGEAAGEISWVSNLRFYGKCGAQVSRVFQGGRLDL
jgi:ribosomal protein S18 acetylase RimI-like enzyme